MSQKMLTVLAIDDGYTTSELQVGVKLPVELERVIFELAALSRPVVIPKFMLVAWYVNKWVEPLLYRTIVFENPVEGYPAFNKDILLRAIQSKPASFSRDSVRHLNFIADYSDNISRADGKTIISACRGVVDLLVTNGSILSDAFTTNPPPLKKLCVPLRHLFYRGPVNLTTPNPSVNFAHPIFSQLTHLDVGGLVQKDSDADNMAGLAALRQLTHLSFNAFRIFSVFHRILTSSTSLRILVLLMQHKDTSKTQGAKGNELLLQDMRFVVMPRIKRHTDWQMEVHAGRDYWTRAEDFVARRRWGLRMIGL